MFDRIVNFFLPKELRGNVADSRYHEFRILVSTCLIGLPLMLLFPIPIHYMGRDVSGYLVNDVMVIITLFCCRYFGHYRIPMTLTAFATYFIIYGWISESGLIFSTNVILLHMFLLCAIWADRRYGWLSIFFNLFIFGFIYYQTLQSDAIGMLQENLGDASYALVMNGLITVFFGGFLAYLQMDQERDRLKFKNLQEQKISLLDTVVKERTAQLGSIRESIASDFHDQTGNLLSAITRQAMLLKEKYGDISEARPIVDGIIANSNTLYGSSKDFLWHLNNESDDPIELFGYLSSFGQQYYNNFDIAFSCISRLDGNFQLPSSAALDLIFIFKEAMTNVVKHAQAAEVSLEMEIDSDDIVLLIRDDGTWKEIDNKVAHYGLENIRRRCVNNGFSLEISNTIDGTLIKVLVPISTN